MRKIGGELEQSNEFNRNFLEKRLIFCNFERILYIILKTLND